MSWFRTYRPRRIADLHLTKVRDTFSALLKQGKLSQVMLFAGPKGTGKTTTARIIAALVNDPNNYPAVEHLFFGKSKPAKLALLEPDTANSDLTSIFDGKSFLVQELDAASNRGIDDIRMIKERVNMPPQSGLMTVYILDEAHMLTTEAFNALLKLLEEPPPHIMFILATTELHKIPDTIKSRATAIEFTKATTPEIVEALTKVLKAEGKEFEPEALEAIAIAAEGSFRDAVKMVETLASTTDKLTLEYANQQLSLSVASHITQLLTAVTTKQPAEVVKVFEELRSKNVDQAFFLKQLLTFLHTSLLQHLGLKAGTAFGTQPVVLFLLQELSQLPASVTTPIPFLPLEVKLLDLIFRSQEKSKKTTTPPQTPIKETVSAVPAKKAIEIPKAEIRTQEPTPEVSASELTAVLNIPKQTEVVSDNLVALSPGDSQKLLSQWEAFVELVKHKNSSLAALLRSAKPLNADNGKATIAVFYKFHKEQLQQPRFLKMIDECVEPLIGGKIQFEFVLQDSVTNSPIAMATTDTTSNTSVQAEVNLVALAEELLV